jgi:DNA-binding transcriptional regulator YhcF (GntR family)
MPKYKRVHGLLIERLGSGDYAPGDRLPSQEKLAAEYGVSLLTMRQAIELLEADGRLEGRHGVGTFVTEPKPPEAPATSIDPTAAQIALVLAETAPIDGYVADTIHALDRQLRDQGRHLLVTSLWNQDVIQGRLPPSLAQPGVLGSIIEHRVEDVHIEFLQHHGVPVVVLGNYALKASVSQVVFNQEEAMRLMCQALLSAQAGDVHFLFQQSGYHYLNELVSGYVRAVRQADRGEHLHLLSADDTRSDVERRILSILKPEECRRPFGLLVHGTPASANGIANLIDRLYGEWGLDPADHPVAIYGDAHLERPEMIRRFNLCGLDVEVGVAAALVALDRLVAGEAPARTVIEPSLEVTCEGGQTRLQLAWRLPHGGAVAHAAEAWGVGAVTGNQ